MKNYRQSPNDKPHTLEHYCQNRVSIALPN